ncbi:hypothetical protein AYO49_00355 [Verrucomicrobiaceae bacterium SCGC AG-212-N21]|nr:hypothetical protein AYO49_00355 [Verrucomicrobiaceae bacterium SCGC AG-212-N21]
MNPLRLLLAGVALLMVSCTSPIVKRIERNPDIYNALSTRHKELVAQGKVEEGMSKKAVFLAWGRPDRAAQGSKGGKAYERWSYAGYDPVYSVGYGPGAWGGGWGYRSGYYYTPFYYEPMMTYVPYEAAKVEFLNGTVTAWAKSR